MNTDKITYDPDEVEVGRPIIWNVTTGRDAPIEAICDTLASQRDEIDSVLYKHGGLLLRGFSELRTAEDFESVILQLTPKLRDYLGGTSPRKVVHGNIMTATYVPSSWSITLHQEMAYTRNPPDRISFFCEQPAKVGGFSTVGDMREALKKVNPEVCRKFDHYGLQLRRTLPSPRTLHLKPGVQKPWSEVLGTSDPKMAEKIISQKGWRAQWINGDTLQMWQDIVPAIKQHVLTGDAIWCNQAHFFSPVCMETWAREDGRILDYEALAKARITNPEMLDNIFLGNGDSITDKEALHVYRVLRSIEHPVQLERGDLLLLDNVLMAHGRTNFEGERSILVALADR